MDIFPCWPLLWLIDIAVGTTSFLLPCNLVHYFPAQEKVNYRKEACSLDTAWLIWVQWPKCEVPSAVSAILQPLACNWLIVYIESLALLDKNKMISYGFIKNIGAIHPYHSSLLTSLTAPHTIINHYSTSHSISTVFCYTHLKHPHPRTHTLWSLYLMDLWLLDTVYSHLRIHS